MDSNPIGKNQDHTSFELVLIEVASRFVNLSPEQLDNRIEASQKTICQYLGIDLSALWQWSDSTPHFLTVTHLYSLPGGPKKPVNIDAEKAFPWVFKKVPDGEAFAIQTEKMSPEASVDQESRRFFGIKSSVVIPLCAEGGVIIGALTFDSFRKERTWPQSLIDRLILIAQIFSSALVRGRGERKLLENENRLRLATSATGVGLWDLDITTGYLWITPQTRKIFQFKPDELINYDMFIEKIIEEDRKKVKQAVQESVDSGDALKVLSRIHLSNSDARWISVKGKVYTDDTGQSKRILGTAIDISEFKQMEETLKRQLEEIHALKKKLAKENLFLQKKIEVQYVHEEIIARSNEMKEILNQVEQVAHTDATVLIEGETGTGKELIAKSVHRLSSRKDRPLVTVNCASLPPALVESELFGREKGAYTGAMTKMIGRFETADGATLFLDEIGELPMEIQPKLLRVLEQGRFERLGSTRTIKVDVRIIAATNKNLAKLVADGKFRKDIYFRLNIFPIHLPSLRERIEDIPFLTWAFVREYEKKMGKRIDNIPRRCIEELQQYSWPGNIRELRNVIERSLIVCKGRTIQIKPLPQNNNESNSNQTLEEIERRHISTVLHRTGWRISGKVSAAEILGLKRTTLQSKMKKLGIQRPSSAADKMPY